MLTLVKKAKLADALIDDYPEVITGYIVDAKVVSGCLVGEAYKTWGYARGEKLISSSITQVIEYGHRWLIKTGEQDCLVVVNFSRGGRQSLLHLINLFVTGRVAPSHWRVH